MQFRCRNESHYSHKIITQANILATEVPANDYIRRQLIQKLHLLPNTIKITMRFVND